MAKNKRATGTRNEKRSAELLNNRDYYTVESRASAGLIDVVGIYMGILPEDNPAVVMVQSKTNHGYSKKDIESLRVLLNPIRRSGLSIVVQLWDWHKHKRTPIITDIGLTPEEDRIL